MKRKFAILILAALALTGCGSDHDAEIATQPDDVEIVEDVSTLEDVATLEETAESTAAYEESSSESQVDVQAYDETWSLGESIESQMIYSSGSGNITIEADSLRHYIYDNVDMLTLNITNKHDMPLDIEIVRGCLDGCMGASFTNNADGEKFQIPAGESGLIYYIPDRVSGQPIGSIDLFVAMSLGSETLYQRLETVKTQYYVEDPTPIDLSSYTLLDETDYCTAWYKVCPAAVGSDLYVDFVFENKTDGKLSIQVSDASNIEGNYARYLMYENMMTANPISFGTVTFKADSDDMDVFVSYSTAEDWYHQSEQIDSRAYTLTIGGAE